MTTPRPMAAAARTRNRLRTTPGSPIEPRTSNHPAARFDAAQYARTVASHRSWTSVCGPVSPLGTSGSSAVATTTTTARTSAVLRTHRLVGTIASANRNSR